MKKSPKEKQYQFMFDLVEKKKVSRLSVRANTMWQIDPKLLGFTLARHKFVAKMFRGYRRVLEVGCGDAFASRVVQPEVGLLHGIDFDPLFVKEAQEAVLPGWQVKYTVHDIVKDGPFRQGGAFDAAFSMDVLEHIPMEMESRYFDNICRSLKPSGAFICGSPSRESQAFASPGSRRGHVNCKSGDDLKKIALKHFQNVFLFGMNDETLHTGFAPMSHYLIVLAVGVRR